MSRKSEKQARRQKNSETGTVNEQMPFVSQDQLFDYLRNIMRRFSGYNFISVSKSFSAGEHHYVLITMHRHIPVQDKDGRYKSDQDQPVRSIYVSNPNFEGMIMDRQKHYAFGNPFRRHEDKKDEVPSIGEEAKPYSAEDEHAEPL